MLGEATGALKAAGYNVDVERQVSSQPTGTVLDVHPDVGDPLVPGRTVTITVAKEAPAPVAPSCHPSYEGACLDPNASDYDCAGGSGDGPKYTGFVQVVGPDVFGLDSDGDGLGCES